VSAHAEFLRAASQDAGLATQIKTDFRKAKISDADRCMLEFVEKLTKFPWLLVESDVRLLREAGFSDVEILHIVLGSAHFNYLNRMADGIGIKFEYKSDIPDFKVPSDSKPIAPNLTGKAADELPHRPKESMIAWIKFPAQPQPEGTPAGPQNLYRVMGENPEARDLSRKWREYQLQATPHLDSRVRARLALFISGLNRCDYSVYWYRQVLSGIGDDQALLDRLAQGKTPDNLSALNQLLFQHAARLTQEPWTTKETHIEQFLQAGLDDKAVLQLTMLASYLSFENRVALGLGITPEQ
jgi:alkylhydroperoxidase family enzyme